MNIIETHAVMPYNAGCGIVFVSHLTVNCNSNYTPVFIIHDGVLFQEREFFYLLNVTGISFQYAIPYEALYEIHKRYIQLGTLWTQQWLIHFTKLNNQCITSSSIQN